MSINWYPGHMAKTRRVIEETLPQIDIVAEVLDARIPQSSRNPDLAKLTENKPHVIILNKCDLADPEQNKKWVDYYKKLGYGVMLFDSKTKKASKPSDFAAVVRETLKEKLERSAARGIVSKNIRLMILGVPNVGKSTFINYICGSAKAKAEDRPGVTRTKQWVPIGNGIDMLDMPGMLWGKLTDQDAAHKLAVTGAISDLVVDTTELSEYLLYILREAYPKTLTERYKLVPPFDEKIHDLFLHVGQKRGYVLRGGEIDEERTAAMLLDEFRAGKLGRITLDVLK